MDLVLAIDDFVDVLTWKASMVESMNVDDADGWRILRVDGCAHNVN